MSFRQNIPNVPGFIYQAQFPFGTHASSILHSPKSALTVLRTLLVYFPFLHLTVASFPKLAVINGK